MILLLLLLALCSAQDLEYRVLSAHRVDLISLDYYVHARLIELCNIRCTPVESISDNDRILQFNHTQGEWRTMNLTVDLIRPDGMLYETRYLNVPFPQGPPREPAVPGYHWYYGTFVGICVGLCIIYLILIKYQPVDPNKTYISKKARDQLLAKEMGIYNE